MHANLTACVDAIFRRAFCVLSYYEMYLRSSDSVLTRLECLVVDFHNIEPEIESHSLA